MKLETRFKQPQEVDKLDTVFGGNISNLMPAFSELPEEIRKRWHGGNKWTDLVNNWMHHGLKGYEFTPKEGIDSKKAFHHMGAIMSSWAPKHEHKIAGVAWLMQHWFEDFKAPEKEESK